MNLPLSIVNDLTTLGINADALAQAHNKPALTSIRYNTNKIITPTITSAIGWCVQGSYLAERPFFAQIGRAHV